MMVDFDIPLVLYFMRFLGFECMVDMMKENSTGTRKRRSSSSPVNKDRVSEFRNILKYIFRDFKKIYIP